MQDDLQAVVALWNVDKGIARAEEGLARLDAAIAACDARLAELARERAASNQRLEALAVSERELAKKLDDSSARKQKTQALIDAGKATDYITATRQVENAVAQINDFEGQIFAILEEQEQLQGRLDELGRQDVLAAARKREALLDRDAASPALKDELARLGVARESAWTQLPQGDRTRYRNLRSQGLRPVARVSGTACAGCRMNVPFQMLNELKSGARTHTCRGCNRWLLVDDDEPS